MIKKLALILLTGLILTAVGCSASDPLTDKLFITDIDGRDAEFESLTSEDVELDTLTIDASVTWDNTTLEELLTFYGDNDLVLYAPLYAPSLQGDSFVSKGVFHHACTATGTIWGTTGRTFNGSGKITVTDTSNILNFTSEDFSFIIWYTPTTTDYRRLISKGDFESEGYEIWGIDESDRAIFLTYQSGAYQVSRTNALALGSPICLGISRSGVSVSMYVNGVANQAVADTHIDPATSSKTFTIGADTDGNNGFDDTISEIQIYYNRALTATEISYIYEITKWRYGY